MNAIANFFSAVVRIFLVICALVFIFGLIILALFFVLISTLWSGLTGRQNKSGLWWHRMQQTRNQVWRTTSYRSNADKSKNNSPLYADKDITDVTEVKDKGQ